MAVQSNAPSEIDECHGKLHPQAIVGLELFNRGEFFESHEALETAWRDEPGPVRELYRGILQVAVAYLHIKRGNYVGARKMFRRCRPWLEPFPDTCRGINLGKLKRDYQIVESNMVRLGPANIKHLNLELIQPIEWHLEPEQSTRADLEI